MNKLWIHEQTAFNVRQWDNAKETYYPESSKYLRNPHEYVRLFCQECNNFEAAKLINWSKYLEKSSQILDIGCGGGWLAGYLSTFESVNTIYALDSCKRLLAELVPNVAKLMRGNPEKIIPIEGLFTPLLLKDGSLDAVIAASSLHHADNLENVLTEIRRALKKGGVLFIINETPRSGLRYLLSITWAFAKIVKKVVVRNYESSSPFISASGYLYDPYLGDKSYPLWYWKEALRRSGFSIIEVMNTGLPTVKGKRGASLTHFICKAT